VKWVAQYGSFEELLDTEGPEKVNPACGVPILRHGD
jgi:hypothetical protein